MLTILQATLNNNTCNSLIEITIGFDPDDYTVAEGTPTVNLFVSVIDGTLERSVTVVLSLEDGTATCKLFF